MGRGIHKNILDSYRYIVQNYSHNDKIYLFGFSRGAYTVRALCGLINNCGILKRADAALISRAWQIYKSPATKYHPEGTDSIQFRSKHCHASRSVHFVGVWDTVGALGIPFSFMGLFDNHDEFYDTKMGANVAYARHALAIDEQREDFAPTVWTPRTGVDLKQVWFSGVHSDIGGSYPPDRTTGIRSSDVTLEWMLGEAESEGLVLEPHIANSITDGVGGTIHKSRNHVYRFKKPLHRSLIIDGKPTRIHPSVKTRYLTDNKYRPPQLKKLVDERGWDSLHIGS